MTNSKQLLAIDALEQSGVVANCRMNRERNLVGSNGYSRDLGFNPVTFLEENAASQKQVRWLDLCCGSGKALIEAAEVVHNQSLDGQYEIIGVDLVGMFFQPASELKCLRLIEASVSNWNPNGEFDLITCVHGLHYIGDKLGLIARAVSWLSKSGRFAANLDLNNIKLGGGRSANRVLGAELQRNGLEYHSRKKLITCDGHRSVEFPFQFFGADDAAGPNYTGQSAVDSYYERSPPEVNKGFQLPGDRV